MEEEGKEFCLLGEAREKRCWKSTRTANKVDANTLQGHEDMQVENENNEDNMEDTQGMII